MYKVLSLLSKKKYFLLKSIKLLEIMEGWSLIFGIIIRDIF